MMTLIAAALVAAQPAPPANPHGQMTPQQHEAMKECCKHMVDKHEGHDAEHDGHGAE